ncbi:ArnT family glycosyltransferase [Pontibacter actiniarum]|nr:hypothetical protein [Pontibacter actiniarum]
MKLQSAANTTRVTRIVLVFVLLFAVLFFFTAHEGLYYSDDVQYSAFAGRLLNGSFDITQDGHTFIHRPTVYVPTAIAYAIFGVNYITYSLWTLLCTLGCIVLTYKAAHQKGLNPAFAAVFLGLTFYFLYFINFLYPDNMVAFFTLVAATVYYRLYRGDNRRVLFKALVFTSSLFIAGLAKETAVVVLPFFALCAARDVIGRKENTKFWAYAALFGLLLLSVYFGWYYLETGDAFYRVSEMETANLSYDNYVTNPSRSYAKRLLWGPVEALLGTGAFMLVVFLIGGGSGLTEAEKRKKLYWSLLFIVSYLTLCFSSTSLQVYNPIKLDARMYNLVIPPLAIAASFGLQKKVQEIRYTLFYTFAFAAIALYLRNSVGAVHGLLALYFAAHTAWLYFRKHSRLPVAYTALAAITFCLLIRPVYFMLKEKTLHYPEHLALFDKLQQLTAQRTKVQVILPHYLYKSTGYFTDYKKVNKLQFYDYSNSIPPGRRGQQLLLLNRSLGTNPSFTEDGPYEQLLEHIAQKPPLWKQGPLELYEL